MRQVTILISFLFLSTFLTAQTINDAIRYSVFDIGGTARTVGVGGALGALGADFSVLSTNPAGLAAYRRSEFVFTPTLVLSNSKSELEGPQNQSIEESKAKFNFNNIGLVLAKRPYSSKWTTANFAIGMNRIANFHQELRYEGTSPGSITDRFLELAFGKSPNELDAFESGLAYDAYAIYEDDPGVYLGDFEYGEEVEKSQEIRRTGSINELVVSFAGNYDEKFMIGASVGVPYLNFEENKTYREIDEDDSNPIFEELSYIERLITTGVGINAKIGAIYRVNQMIRVGASIHTPTAFKLEDSWNSRMIYQYSLPDCCQPEQQSPDGFFEYKFRTPWRYMGSIGVIVKKYGFLSAEVEYVTYNSANFKFDNTDSSEDLDFVRTLNNQIATDLEGGLNIRLGGEFAYNNLRFRAGYNISDAPEFDAAETNSSLSLGFGIRGKNAFADFAYKRIMNNENYIPFITNDKSLQSAVAIKDSRNKLMLTLGFKF